VQKKMKDFGNELKDVLLSGGLESPSPRACSDQQLRRDLSRALLQATTLQSPGQKESMPPPPVPEESSNQANGQNGKARKRKLEEDLGSEESSTGVSGMFDMLGPVAVGEERMMLKDLLADDTLGLLQGRSKSTGGARSRGSKLKDKEKGKPNRCRCDRSGCLKRYCVCFAAGNVCADDCKCKDCHNDERTEERKQRRALAMQDMEKKKANAFTPRIGTDKVHTSGCNCKKSGCRKRYCECFQAGVRCTEKCKCCECHNPAGVNPLSLLPSLPQLTFVEEEDVYQAMDVDEEVEVVTKEIASPKSEQVVRTPSNAASPSVNASLIAVAAAAKATAEDPAVSTSTVDKVDVGAAVEATPLDWAEADACAGDESARFVSAPPMDAMLLSPLDNLPLNQSPRSLTRVLIDTPSLDKLPAQWGPTPPVMDVSAAASSPISPARVPNMSDMRGTTPLSPPSLQSVLAA